MFRKNKSWKRRLEERNGKIVTGIEQYLTHVNFDKIPKCVRYYSLSKLDN